MFEDDEDTKSSRNLTYDWTAGSEDSNCCVTYVVRPCHILNITLRRIGTINQKLDKKKLLGAY